LQYASLISILFCARSAGVSPYDKNDRLLQTAKTTGQNQEIVNYQYDANGNTISALTETLTSTTSGTSAMSLGTDGGYELYTYNGFNQLTATIQDGVETTYVYKPDGLRYNKTTAGTTTTHIWDGANIAAELTGSTVSATYVRGINLITKGGGSQYYSFNAHGDVVQLTNSSGTVTKDYRYDAFGVEVDPQGTDTNPWRYCGEYWDRETGTVYLRARYYDPVTSRILSEDTYRGNPKDLLSLNLYVYCLNNPLMYIDPTGHVSQWLADTGDYVWRSGKQVVMGNYTDDVTLLGTGGQIALGLTGVDIVGDVRDVVYDLTHWEWSWEHAGQFGLDAVGLIPLVGALKNIDEVGALIKGGAKATNKIDDVADVTKIINKSDDVANIGKYVGNGVCFVTGTLISTRDGLRPIEKISIGDIVYSENPDTGAKGTKTVAQTFVRQTKELLHIQIGKQKISTTPEHPFYVPQKGWVASIELRAGDKLLLRSGGIIVIEQVQHEILEVPITVYNFEVADWHTYYVSKSGVLVHNACKGNNIPENLYTSIKKAPGYNSNFVQAQNGLQKVNINNKELLHRLNQLGNGWKKVYQNGYINGEKLSYHYFQSSTGKIFDFWVKKGWS
jgi:RHS repeat-associated protein